MRQLLFGGCGDRVHPYQSGINGRSRASNGASFAGRVVPLKHHDHRMLSKFAVAGQQVEPSLVLVEEIAILLAFELLAQVELVENTDLVDLGAFDRGKHRAWWWWVVQPPP